MITITGATGQLGSLIIENLLESVDAGEVTAVTRNPAKATKLAEKGVVLRQGDYGDYDSLVSAFADTDVLMFISNTDVKNRMQEHQNVVNAAKKAGVSRIVYTSAALVGEDDMLAKTHENSENMIIESGIPYTFLRNGFYMDAYVVEVEIAMKTGVYRSPSGDAGAAFVSRADIARMAAKTLASDGHEGKVYSLTGAEAVKPVHFAELAARLSGKAVVYQPISWEELAEDYRGRGMPEAYVDMSVMLEQIIATNALSEVSADIEVVTGTPAESFESFVSRVVVPA